MIPKKTNVSKEFLHFIREPPGSMKNEYKATNKVTRVARRARAAIEAVTKGWSKTEGI